LRRLKKKEKRSGRKEVKRSFFIVVPKEKRIHMLHHTRTYTHTHYLSLSRLRAVFIAL